MSEGGGGDECLAAAIWNGSALIEAGGAPTTINGTLFSGSVQELNPSTGQPIWQTGLPGPPVGSCSEDGAGVVACSVYTGDTPQDMGFYLLNASNGQIIGHISTPGAFLFAQPVFDNNDLILAGRNGIGVTAYEITTPGAPVTSVSPSTVTAGTTSTITLGGSGFQTGAKVFVSGTLVGGQHGTSVKSPTQLTFTLTPSVPALGGSRDITVIEPGSPAVANVCTSCLDIQSKLRMTAPSSLPTGTEWQYYSQSIGITGGVAPYNVSITSGQLPQGMSLDQNGDLTADEITSAGTFTFTVQATDGTTPSPQVATATYTLDVTSAPEPQTITFTSTNPSPVTVGAPSYTPTATASSGLPVMISLDASSTGCTLSSGVVSFPSAGTCVIDANQAGNSSWAPGELQQSIITINPGPNSMTVSPSTLSAGATRQHPDLHLLRCLRRTEWRKGAAGGANWVAERSLDEPRLWRVRHLDVWNREPRGEDRRDDRSDADCRADLHGHLRVEGGWWERRGRPHDDGYVHLRGFGGFDVIGDANADRVVSGGHDLCPKRLRNDDRVPDHGECRVDR